jgi:DNA polymerase elongation subunit (family B)
VSRESVSGEEGRVKVLVLDIETSPNVAHVWGLWDQTVSLSQLQETSNVISFSAKWLGSKKTEFYSVHHDGKERMLSKAYQLLTEADVVIHYNGSDFDLPHLRREFLLAGMPPPSPVAEVDLLKVVRGRFKFVSNKLEHISKSLKIGQKVKHAGHELWVKCMAGDKKAWATMRKYNMQDVVLTEKVYKRLLPWISNHPHLGVYNEGKDCCQRCGGTQLQRRGFYRTTTSTFQRYQCSKCGSWSRGSRFTIKAPALRGIQ